MAIYRKNAGRAMRYRKATGKKMFTSLKSVTDDRGVKHGIEEANGKFYRLRDGKRVPKAEKSKSKDPHKHFLTRESAAFFLARMADPELGKSENRADSKFVREGQANKKKGLRLGHVSGGRASTQKKTSGKKRGGKKSGSKHGYGSPMEMKWGEDISLGDAWAVFRGEMTLDEAKGVKSNPGRGSRRGRGGSIDFYDLY
jgi:hypothetical protein